MRLEDYDDLLSEGERKKNIEQVVGEVFPHLPKEINND